MDLNHLWSITLQTEGCLEIERLKSDMIEYHRDRRMPPHEMIQNKLWSITIHLRDAFKWNDSNQIWLISIETEQYLEMKWLNLDRIDNHRNRRMPRNEMIQSGMFDNHRDQRMPSIGHDRHPQRPEDASKLSGSYQIWWITIETVGCFNLKSFTSVMIDIHSDRRTPRNEMIQIRYDRYSQRRRMPRHQMIWISYNRYP